MDAEDRPLIIGLKRGDMASFEKIFSKYRRAVFSYVRGMLSDDGLAEDCVQDVFLELARRAESIDIQRGVRGWLFRVARNKAIDAWRKRSREFSTPDTEIQDEESVVRPYENMIVSEKKEEIMQAVDSLKETEREIVLLRFFGGLTFAEAEDATGVPLNTLIWRCRRALEKLAGIVRKED